MDFSENNFSLIMKDFLKGFDLRKFSILILIAIILNLYPLSNFSISIDDEFVAFGGSYNWYMSNGRWTTALLDRFIFTFHTYPYILNLLFSISLALSFNLLIRVLKIKNAFQIYLTYIVFVTYPVWRFLTDFDGIFPAISLGLALVSFSGFLFARTHKNSYKTTSLWLSLGLQIVLIATAIGSYQSFLLLYFAISSSIIIYELLNSNQFSFISVIYSCFQIIIVALLGFGLSSLIARIGMLVLGVQSAPYLINNFINLDNLISNPLQALKNNYLLEMWAYYSGDPNKFGVTFHISIWMFLLSFLFIVKKSWQKTIQVKITVFFFVIVLISSPFFINLLGSSIPTRSLFPISYILCFMSLLLVNEKNRFLRALNICVIILFIFQSILINSMYDARSSISQQYDRLLAADLYNRIGLTDRNFDRNQPVQIDVYGKIDLNLLYPNPWSGAIGASFFDWDEGNLHRMVYYMKLIGYMNILPLPDDERLIYTPYFEEMSVWPAAGCVKEVNGIYLIKLNESPDPLHHQFYTSP